MTENPPSDAVPSPATQKKPSADAGLILRYFLACSVVIVGITFLFNLVMGHYFGKDYPTRGQFGDQFGGLNAIFSGLAFLGLVLTLALQTRDLRAQTRALELQQDALRLQIDEFREQREELKRTAEAQEKYAIAQEKCANAQEKYADSQQKCAAAQEKSLVAQEEYNQLIRYRIRAEIYRMEFDEALKRVDTSQIESDRNRELRKAVSVIERTEAAMEPIIAHLNQKTGSNANHTLSNG